MPGIDKERRPRQCHHIDFFNLHGKCIPDQVRIDKAELHEIVWITFCRWLCRGFLFTLHDGSIITTSYNHTHAPIITPCHYLSAMPIKPILHIITTPPHHNTHVISYPCIFALTRSLSSPPYLVIPIGCHTYAHLYDHLSFYTTMHPSHLSLSLIIPTLPY